MSTSTLQSASPVGPDGVVRCDHKVSVSVSTSTSAHNFGRKFYACFKKRVDPDNCKFFKWADELPQSSQCAAISSVSQPKTPLKRSRGATPPTSNVSPSKTSTKVSLNDSDPIEDVDDFVNWVSDEEISQFLGRRSPDEPPAKKYKFRNTEEISGRNITPGSLSASQSLPFSPTRMPTQKTSQWQAIRDDSENPFHVHAASVVQDRLAMPPLSSLASPNTSVVTGESIMQGWEFWSAVPGAFCKLERKLIATEKARDARAARVAKLEKEVQDLKDRLRSLEEALRARR